MYATVWPKEMITLCLEYRLNGWWETLTIGRYGASDGISLLLARVRWMLGRPTESEAHVLACEPLAQELGPHWQGVLWSVSSRFMADGVALRQKAATFFQFYLNQLPPLARQDFLRWPDRRDAFGGKGTNVLDPFVPRPQAAVSRRGAG